ncbi:MAG: zinc ribbon domain-containing protein [Methanobrevibacter sp.]|nr:zinc ribbon domain-containing protein [Methanobrevibacter sp.]
MVYCSYCGARNRDDVSHCSNCGERLPIIRDKNQNIPQNNYSNQQNSNRPISSNQIPNNPYNRPIKNNYLRDNRYNKNFTDEDNNLRLDNRHDNFQDSNQKKYPKPQFNNKNNDNPHKTVNKTAVEWDVVIATALIVIIISAILQRVFPFLSIFMALLIGLIYILIATKSKLSLFKSIPLAILMILAVSAYFSL